MAFRGKSKSGAKISAALWSLPLGSTLERAVGVGAILDDDESIAKL